MAATTGAPSPGRPTGDQPDVRRSISTSLIGVAGIWRDGGGGLAAGRRHSQRQRWCVTGIGTTRLLRRRCWFASVSARSWCNHTVPGAQTA